MATTLLLARHGHIDWSGRIGAVEDGLSRLGRLQAQALARHLARYRVGAIHSSDLRRATETAAAIGQALRLPVRPEPALREHNLGAWQGQRQEEVRRRYRQRWARLEAGDPDYAPPGGETLRDLQRRAVDAFGRILSAAHPGQTVLAVSHGGLLAAYICHVLDVAFEGAVPIVIDNCSLTVVEGGNNGLVLASFNGVSHLEGLPAAGEA
ncbi:MAG: histidine phosphatase family protein [Dehalococcoidia bacterium]